MQRQKASLKPLKRIVKKYVWKLDINTSVKKVWDMVRKINGKPINTNKYLNKWIGEKCTEIVNLAEEFENNNKSLNPSLWK